MLVPFSVTKLTVFVREVRKKNNKKVNFMSLPKKNITFYVKHVIYV